jgi:hypothetical protein
VVKVNLPSVWAGPHVEKPRTGPGIHGIGPEIPETGAGDRGAGRQSFTLPEPLQVSERYFSPRPPHPPPQHFTNSSHTQVRRFGCERLIINQFVEQSTCTLVIVCCCSGALLNMTADQEQTRNTNNFLIILSTCGARARPGEFFSCESCKKTKNAASAPSPLHCIRWHTARFFPPTTVRAITCAPKVRRGPRPTKAVCEKRNRRRSPIPQDFKSDGQGERVCRLRGVEWKKGVRERMSPGKTNLGR